MSSRCEVVEPVPDAAIVGSWELEMLQALQAVQAVQAVRQLPELVVGVGHRVIVPFRAGEAVRAYVL